MDDHTLKILEFEEIRNIVASFTVTELGRLAALNLSPAITREEACKLLSETEEMVRFLSLNDQQLFSGRVCDSMTDLKKARKYGRPLEPGAILSISALIQSAHSIKKLFSSETEASFPALKSRAEKITISLDLALRIEETIDARGRISDWASEKLGRLREKISSLRETIRKQINSLVQKKNINSCLQQEQVSLRNDRYVLSVRNECRGQVKGVIHGHSQTGSTVYIEPEQCLEPGNDLVRITEEAKREETRILLELTKIILGKKKEIREAQEFVSWADLTLAKRELVRIYHFTVPEISDDHVFSVNRARHPLLMWYSNEEDKKKPDLDFIYQQVVPFDLEFGSDFRILIITGPNTGGKTVVLKTIGLLGLMASAGLPVSAFAPTRIPFYKHIFIDTGDEQSLQQSLSTFSSHMLHIIDVLNNASDSDLVVLDELGAGTDPLEGAALGMSVLDHLKESGAHTIVSTHLGSLKQYAYTNKEAENAAMEFNPDSLKPTFRLLLGIPGRSCALMVAKRLGMPDKLLTKAEELIERPESQEKVIKRMEKARRSVELERNKSRKISRRIGKMKKKLATKLNEADTARRQATREAEEEIDSKVREIREKLLKILPCLKNVPGQFKPHVDEIELLAKNILVLTPLGERREIFARSLKKNNEVYVPILSGMCRILRINKGKRRLTVINGNIEVEIGFDDVSWVTPKAD